MVKLVLLFVLRVLGAPGPSLANYGWGGRGRLLDRFESGQRKKRVEVLHENLDALHLVFVERVDHHAEVVVDSENASDSGASGVRREEAVAAAEPSGAFEALPSLWPTALFERELAVDAFRLAAPAWVFPITPVSQQHHQHQQLFRGR